MTGCDTSSPVIGIAAVICPQPTSETQAETPPVSVGVRRMFDGYDNGVRDADEHIGRLFNALADQGVLDDTVIIISADHATYFVHSSPRRGVNVSVAMYQGCIVFV